ncbi:glutathione S-transferase family protein [Acaryochloris marina]|uniref:Glutathione S-transferase II n=1 Tax=Acaryochloris marina (strain MBIC 11017) TaxID=329726 RepID=B0C6W1_ACAM1|nr:glutathione S-transferase [Acaryochloris marina]ABW27665.1 glutathione S-transferase II [Acaryochloris marina MBIC11017]BDM82400.1 glutathione S-transferase [Acaryochloris marina MBIC10699]
MKVYEFKGFPNPARVRIALAEKGLTEAVEFVSVDVPNGEHKQSEFLAKNPSGTVPVLELDDGTTIAECTAITEYLDHTSGETTLTGRTPKERAMIHMMQRRAEAGLLDAVGLYFHHATPGLGPDIEAYQCSEWGEHQRQKAIAGMHYLNDVLAQNTYLAGEQFSMADITAFAGLVFADFAKIEIPAECGHLKAWRERVSQRPSVAG